MSRKEEILARCIDEVRSGRCTVEECLGRYPELRNELRPLLEVALSIQPPQATPSEEFRRRARNRLLAEMQPSTATATGKPVFPRRFVFALSVRAVATLALAFIVLMAVSSGVYAAQSSLPGDVLYPVKIGTEKLQVAVSVNPEDKAYLHLKLAQRRIDEVTVQISRNRQTDVSGLATLPAETDAALREIKKVSPHDASTFLSYLAESTINQQVILSSLLTMGHEDEHESLSQAMSTVQRTNLIADAAYNNPAFLRTSPSVRDHSLEQGRFEVDGKLVSVDGQTWNIGGLTLPNVRYSGKTPPLNSRVKVEGLNKNNEVFITKLEQEDDGREEVKIEGTFKSTDASGKTWNISEMHIDAPSDKIPPAEGEKLQLHGTTQDGSLAITDIKEEREEEREKENEARLEGKISAFEPTNGLLTIKVTGAQISLNISSAKIYNEDGKAIKPSELASLVGKKIKAFGLIKKDDTFFAKEVRVDAEKPSKRNSK